MNPVLLAAEPIVNVYATPSLDAEVTSQIRYGWPAQVLEQTGEWVHLRTLDDHESWAPSKSFILESKRSHLVQITALSANLYLVPDVKTHAPILNIPFESRLELVSEEDSRWLQVRLLDGRLAFLHRGDATLHPAPMLLLEAFEQASRFLGITYTWGGTSAYGFDCSGFVQMVFRQAGTNLPRDAQMQCHWPGFQAIGREALQPGDVLFFSESRSEDHINHVALYLGNSSGTPGRFLHDTTAETHPGIQFSSLDQEHWRTRLTACRRLR